MPHPTQFENVTAVAKANVYFDGKVVSHTITKNGVKQTLGLIYPGSFKFNTGVAERMDITDGSCKVKLAGASTWTTYGADQGFDVPANSYFEIAVESGIAQYICSFK
jgi:purine/pyrimidine-nucleoside phosphorylase